jgi:signal transduction histidine kinase
MGLGLAIAKELVELNRGRIWATSALGEGSQFYVAFPAYESPS